MSVMWDEMTEKDMSHLVQTCRCFQIIYCKYGTCISHAILSDQSDRPHLCCMAGWYSKSSSFESIFSAVIIICYLRPVVKTRGAKKLRG